MADPDQTPEALKRLCRALNYENSALTVEAAAAISALMAERDALVKALLPFAEVADWAERNGCDLLNDVDYITCEECDGEGCLTCNGTGIATIARSTSQGGEG